MSFPDRRLSDHRHPDLTLMIEIFLHFFYIANMQFLNMHLLYTLILHSNDLNQLSFLLSYMSICPPKKLSLSFYLKESIQ